MTKDKGAPARMLLVRHGQIRANLDSVWHGSTDSGLTARGHEQARRVGEHLARTRPHISALYASPLERTRHTAEPIAEALGISPELEPDLVEFGIGQLEGVSYAALLSEHRFFERIHADPDYAPPGGESLRGVTDRVTATLRRIARAHRGEEVVVVGHGAALGLALALLIEGQVSAWRRYHLSNGSLSELVLEPAPTLLSFDQTEHLGEG